MLKAIHNQEDLKAAREKAEAVVEKLKTMRLQKAAKIVQEGYEETLSYFHFPSEHWTRLRTNNALERLNREIRRRTKVIGNFPDGESALMLVSARVRHVASTKWGKRAYMNMELLREQDREEQRKSAVV
jgi:transposase-like protein